MMAFNTYTFSKEPIRLGTYDEKYGQGWWGDVNEDLKPVKFNTMNQSATFAAGDVISYDESVNKRSTKGTDYLQLRKVQVVSKNPTQAPETAQVAPPQSVAQSRHYPEVPPSSSHAQLDRIEQKLDKLLGIDEGLAEESNDFPEYRGDGEDNEPDY